MAAKKDIGSALAALLEAVDARIDERVSGFEDDPWLDKARSPLGAQHNRVCRSGKIQGARLVGRRWLARRSAIDAFVAACPAPTPRKRTTPDKIDALIADIEQRFAS